MRFLILFLLSISLAFSFTDTIEEQGDLNLSQEGGELSGEIEAKLLYQSYYELPKKLFKGQVFTLTIKTLSAKEDYKSLHYEFSNALGVELLSEEKERKVIAPYFYDTFYFQVTGSQVRTPDISTSLIFKNYSGGLQETLAGKSIQTFRLNPEKDFSSVLAREFRVLDYKTTQYDNQHNIVVFSAEAKMANLKNFSLKAAAKEGIDAYEESLPHSNFTYYAVVSRQLNELKFSYFDLDTRHFQDIIIPIIVENDRVSTQTDLAPTQNTHVYKKMILAGAISAIGLLFFIFRRKKLYLVVFILPLLFIAKLAVPIKHVCIIEDSNIYLLPMKNGTVFEQVPYRFTTEELGSTEDFTKIRMQNNQIGWVKHENLCKN